MSAWQGENKVYEITTTKIEISDGMRLILRRRVVLISKLWPISVIVMVASQSQHWWCNCDWDAHIYMNVKCVCVFMAIL